MITEKITNGIPGPRQHKNGNQHFAEVIAGSLIRSGIVPNQELCERWFEKIMLVRPTGAYFRNLRGDYGDMNEREPEIPKFVLNLGEEKVVCTPENTLAFLYEEEKYDHIFTS